MLTRDRMRTVNHWLLATFLCLSMWACDRAGTRPVAPQAIQASVAFVNVSVVPMDSERVLSNQTVLVHEGRIVAIGPRDDVPVPAGAQQIDGAGRYLMPGLADMHVHAFAESDQLLFVANGVTAVRVMWGSPQALALRSRIAEKTLLGPQIFSAGPIVDGAPPVWNSSQVVTGTEDAKRAVADHKAAGYDFIKVYNRLTPASYEAMVAASREHDIRLVGHVPTAVGLDRVLSAGQASIEHLTGYMEAVEADDSPVRGQSERTARLKRVDHIDESKIAAVARRTAEAGVWNCVTLIVTQRLVPASKREEMMQAPEIKYVSPMIKAFWDPAKDFRTKTLTDADWVMFRKGDAVRMRLTRALHEAGAGILLGTDTPNPFVVPGFSIHEELQNLVTAGLRPFDALRAGTHDAAVFMGQLDSWGTVAVGKRADLVLLNANPLDDIGATRDRVGVMVNGAWHAQDALDAKLEQLAAAFATPASRFDDKPPLASHGTRTFTGRYELFFSDVSYGEERVAVDRSDRGDMIITSEQVIDPPQKMRIETRIDLARERVQQMSVNVHNDDGLATSVATRATNRVERANGNIRLENAELGDDDVLGSGMAAGLFALVPRLYDLAVGDSVTLNGRHIEYIPALQVTTAGLTIQRDADTNKSTPLGDRRAHVFDVWMVRPNTTQKMTVWFDRDYRLLAMRSVQQTGVLEYRRIE